MKIFNLLLFIGVVIYCACSSLSFKIPQGILTGIVQGVDSAYLVFKTSERDSFLDVVYWRTLDSIPVINGRFIYKYCEKNGSRMVQVFLQKNDSICQMIFFVNPYVKKDYVFRVGEIYLDNSCATLYLDSVMTKTPFYNQISARIEGSPETNVMYKVNNDMIFVNHYFKKDGTLINSDFIRENSNSSSLLNFLYINNMYSSVETLRSYFNLFDSSVRASAIGKQMETYLTRKETLIESGIAKEFSFYDTNEQIYHFKDFISNKRLGLIVFWASWCGPCRAELPELKKLYERYQGSVAFSSLSIDRNCSAWTQAVHEDSTEWVNLSGHPESATKVADLFNVTAVPSFLLIDELGHILFSSVNGQAELNGVTRVVKVNDIADLIELNLKTR